MRSLPATLLGVLVAGCAALATASVPAGGRVAAAGEPFGVLPRPIESPFTHLIRARAAALGHPEVDLVRVPSADFGIVVDVLRFVPRDDETRADEAARLMADVVAPLAHEGVLIVLVDAVRELEPRPLTALVDHEWSFWRSPDSTWRRVNIAAEDYVATKLVEAGAAGDAYALGYWGWLDGMRAKAHGRVRQSLRALEAAAAALRAVGADPLGVRDKVLAALVWAHAERGDESGARRCADDLIATIAAEAADSAATPVYSVAPEFRGPRGSLPARAIVEFTIDATGRPADARVVSARPRAFGHAVRAALSGWWYVPRMVDGRAVATPGMRIELRARG